MLNNTCLMRTANELAMLEKWGLHQTESFDPFNCYTTIIPYLAEHLYREGIAIRGIDTSIDSINDLVNQNLNLVKPYIDILQKTYKAFDKCEFLSIEAWVSGGALLNPDAPSRLNRMKEELNLTSENNDRPYEDLKFQLISKMFDGTLTEQQALALGYIKTTNKSENTNNNKTIEYGHDFRRVQERVRKGSGNSRRATSLTRDEKGRLGRLLRNEVESQSSNNGIADGLNLTHTNKKGETTTFNIRKDVSPQLFHDVFEIVRHYTPNGELVDLHDDYSNCKCYLNEDGTCGFAIEPDGNLVSVFNLGLQKGFLPAVSNYILQQGASHLDAYNSTKQPHTVEPLFVEESSTGYRERTIKNAKADATIALAADFTSAGERLTKKAVLENGKKYIPIDTNNPEITDELVESIVSQLNEVKAKSLNIAGNGIYTLKGKYTQEQVDEYVYNLLNRVLNHPNLQTKIESIRSGGQTGYEEAGIKAAMRLGIKNGILAPKGWKFRGINGRDISNEQAFKARFNIQPQQSKPQTTTKQPIDTHQENNPEVPSLTQQMVPPDTGGEAVRELVRVRSGRPEETKELDDYKTPINNTTIKMQQDTLAIAMSVQQRQDAVKNIAKWFNNILNSYLQQYEQELIKGKKYTTEAKAHQEHINRDMWARIKFEQGCKNPNQELIKKFKDRIIPLDKLDVIRLHGISELKQVIKDAISQKEGLEVISDNFDALFLEAASEINKRYNINILDNFSIFDADENNTTNTDDQSDSSEQEEKSPENNYIRSDDRSRSTESSLSQDIKECYDKCVVRDQNGKIVKDSFGFNKSIDPSIAHAQMLKYTQNIIDFDDMMSMIASSEESWINSVDEEGKPKKGCLRYLLENDDQLANSFYYNYKGSAQRNSVIVADSNGKIRLVTLNEVDSSETMMKQTASNIASGYQLTDMSVYDSKGEISKDNIAKLVKKIGEVDDAISKVSFSEITPETFQDIIYILKSLGFDLSKDYNLIGCIKYETSKADPTDREKTVIVRAILSQAEKVCKELSKQERLDTDITQLCHSYYNSFVKFLFIGSKDLSESSVSESGKTYNTYGKTNYIDELFKKLKRVVKGKKNADGSDYYTSWINRQFGDSAFFRFNGQWLNDWLEKLTKKGPEGDLYRSLLVRDNVISSTILGIKEDFTKWSEETSILSNFLAYYNGQDFKLSNNNERAAYYRMTIASNSPAGDFIRFVKYVSDSTTSYDDIIADKMWNVCKQELIRMEDVAQHLQKRMDGTSQSPSIASYDAELEKDNTLKTAGGLVFCLMPRLNYVLVGNNHKILSKLDEETRTQWVGKSFVDFIKFLDHKDSREKFNLEESDIKQFFTEVWKADFQEDFEEEYEATKDTLLKVPQLKSLDQSGKLKDAYRNYCMNYGLAFTQLVQLTCTDMAFFGKKAVIEVADAKDADFRHTFTTTDAQGNTVKQTKYYQITADNALDTFQKRNKEYHAPVKKISTRKFSKPYFREVTLSDVEIQSQILANVRASVMNNKYMSSELKKKIVDAFDSVNVADGWSLRRLESYMELLDGAGKLDAETRECFNAILHGRIDDGIFFKVFMAIKPYFYGVLRNERDTVDANGNSYTTMVPTQHKNSEYPLMALTIAAGALGHSTLLKGINQFMNDNSIDVVHFSSVVKVGNKSVLNVPLDGKNVKDIADRLSAQIKDGSTGNEINVEQVPIENWGIQTDKPEHLVDKQQLVGSQARRLILSDIPEDAIINVRGKNYTKEEFTKHYQELITQDLLESFSQVDEMFKDIRKLSKFLQSYVAGSNKYDDDMIRMFEVNDQGTGFVLPVWDATVNNKVDEILNALIRNRIVKQKMKGGAVVQAAAVGLDRKLNVRYRKIRKDSQGNPVYKDGRVVYDLIPTFNEWLEKNPNGSRKEYEDTVAKDSVIAYMECYLPLWSKDLMEKYIVDGRIDDSKFPESLRYLVGYRVPTEDHCSMAPLKVVGFLSPSEASSIVLPADITVIAGSDFDIDVMYLLLPEHFMHKYDMAIAKRDYAATEKAHLGALTYASEQTLNSHSPRIEAFNRWFNEHKDDVDENGKPLYLLPKDQWIANKVEYKEGETNSRAARHNEFLDMCFGCLTSSHSLEKFTNPQNFEEVKIASRLCELNKYYPYEELKEQLEKFGTDKERIKYLDALRSRVTKRQSISSPRTATHLHQQNMIGNELVGIAAVANALQQVMESNPLEVNEEYRFTLNNNESNHNEFVLGNMRNARNALITKNIAKYLAAFVDNGKDPIAEALVANPRTMQYITYLAMLGYTHLEISALLNVPSIYEYLINGKEFNSPNSTKEAAKRIPPKVAEEYAVANSDTNVLNLTIEEMMRAAREPESGRTLAVNEVAWEVFGKIRTAADVLNRSISPLLRTDSPNGNVGKSILPAFYKYITYKTLEFKYQNKGKAFIFRPVHAGASILPITYYTPDTIMGHIKEDIETSKLPYLQAFTSCSLTSSLAWLRNYSLCATLKDIIEKYVLNPYWSIDKQEKVYRQLCADYQMYCLLGTPLFGREGEKISEADKFTYYATKFPQEFVQWQQNLPEQLKDNLFIKNIVYKKEQFGSLEINNLGTSSYARQQLKAEFSKIMDVDPDMAIKLFVYSAIKNGFRYSPTGWCHLVDSEVKLQIPDYATTVASMRMQKPPSGFLEMWLRNNYSTIKGLVPNYGDYVASALNDYFQLGQGTLKFDSDEQRESRINNMYRIIDMLPTYFTVDDKLVLKVGNEEDGFTFEILPKLGLGTQFHEFRSTSLFNHVVEDTSDEFDNGSDSPVPTLADLYDSFDVATADSNSEVKSDKQPIQKSDEDTDSTGNKMC